MSISIAKKKLLIVEGRDEENLFMAALTEHLHIADVQVLAIGGKTNLARNLRALKNDVGFSDVASIAIVRDADTTAAGSTTTAAKAALQSVQSALASVNLTVPVTHATFQAGPPRVGVFIMPDGVQDGMLETLPSICR